MKICVIEGTALADAAAIYGMLAAAFGFPAYFGNNPDALWDALGEYSGEPVEIIWRDGGSAERLGAGATTILHVLEQAEAAGRLILRRR